METGSGDLIGAMQPRRLLPVVLLALVACTAASRTCGSDYGDVATRTMLSNIVFEGTMLGRYESVNGRYNATFGVERIFKGSLPLRTGSEYMPVIAGDFAAIQDEELCLPSVALEETYLVFLKDQRHPKVPFFPIKGFPEVTSKKFTRIIKQAVQCQERSQLGDPSCMVKPSVRTSKMDVRARGGGTVDLRCKADGYPPPVIDWVKDKKPLKGAVDVDIVASKRGSRMTIKNIRQEDKGTYLCVARNLIGNDVAQIELTVIGGEIALPHEALCEAQTYCLNGGQCYYLRNLGTKFCKCKENYMGTRCQYKDVFDILRTMKSRDELKFDRTMTIAGIIIGALVLVAMCIAAYCMAKNKREQFYKKRAERERLKRQEELLNKPKKERLQQQQPNGMLLNMTNPSGVILRGRAESTRSVKSTTTQTSPEPATRWQSQPTGVGSRNSPPPMYNSCGRRSRSGSDHSARSSGYSQRDGRRRLQGLSCSAEVIDDRIKAHPNFIVNAVVESDQEASKRSSPSQSSKTESAHGHLGLEMPTIPTWQGSVGSLEEDDQASDYDNPTSDADLASDGPSQPPDIGSGSQESHPREMEVSSSSEGSDTEDSSSGPGEEHALFQRLKSNPPVNNPKRQSPSWHGSPLDDFMPNHYMLNPYAREQDIVPSKYMQNPRHTDNENDRYNYIYSPENYMDGSIQLIDPDPDATVV